MKEDVCIDSSVVSQKSLYIRNTVIFLVCHSRKWSQGCHSRAGGNPEKGTGCPTKNFGHDGTRVIFTLPLRPLPSREGRFYPSPLEGERVRVRGGAPEKKT
jgi:hypothetical protein